MALYEFEGKRPVVADGAFVFPSADVIGDVVIGAGCFVGAGAVLRGDYGRIRIGEQNDVVHSERRRVSAAEQALLHGNRRIVDTPAHAGDDAVRDLAREQTAQPKGHRIDAAYLGAVTHVPYPANGPSRRQLLRARRQNLDTALDRSGRSSAGREQGVHQRVRCRFIGFERHGKPDGQEQCSQKNRRNGAHGSARAMRDVAASAAASNFRLA